MNNLKCQIQKHNGEKILTVCLDKKCREKQRLCCLQCLSKSHNTHLTSLVEVDNMCTFLQQESNKKIECPESCSYGQNQIIQGLEKLNTLITDLQKIIIEKIQAIKQQNLQQYLKSSGNDQQGLEQWNKLLEGILQYVQVDDCVVSLTTTKEGQLNGIEEQQIKIIKQSENSLQSMMNQINPTEMSIGKLCFKNNRKNVDIEIIDDCIIKKTKTTSHAIAFANEGFDPSYQSYAFAFNIYNLASDVWVGIGNDEGGVLPSYIMNFTQLGHGQYMVSQNSYTFHHTDGEINHKQGKGMTYKTGDKIQIQYDHVTKVLEFKKQSEQNAIVKMTITDLTKKLYPCAFLYNPNDSAQLVDY